MAEEQLCMLDICERNSWRRERGGEREREGERGREREREREIERERGGWDRNKRGKHNTIHRKKLELMLAQLAKW